MGSRAQAAGCLRGSALKPERMPTPLRSNSRFIGWKTDEETEYELNGHAVQVMSHFLAVLSDDVKHHAEGEECRHSAAEDGEPTD